MNSAAAVNYVISADDKTRAALAQVRRGFQQMDSGIRSSVRTANLALGALAGVGLKNMFRNVLTATKEAAGAQSGFAQALDETRKAARNLLAAKGGLPEATDNLNELAGILKDPAVISAADALTSTLIKGFSASAKFLAEMIAGLKIVFTGKGGIDSIDKAMAVDRARSEIDAIYSSSGGKPRGTELERIRKLNRQISDIMGPASLGDFMDSTVGSHATYLTATEDLERVLELQKKVADAAKEARKQAAEDRERTAADAYATRRSAMKDFSRETEGTFDDLNADRFFDQYIDSVGRAIDETKKLSTFADEAARNMQDAFANFLFDPFREGIKGMLKGFVDVLRRMAAEAAASKFFDWFKASAGGAGFFGGLGKLLGFADGGSFRVGGSGGTDSQLVAFKATPGEMVDVRTPGQDGSGVVIAPVYQIDARGATSDLVQALPAILEANTRRTVELARVAVRNDISRGRIK